MNVDQNRQRTEPGQNTAGREDRREVYEIGRNIEWLCDPERLALVVSPSASLSAPVRIWLPASASAASVIRLDSVGARTSTL